MKAYLNTAGYLGLSLFLNAWVACGGSTVDSTSNGSSTGGSAVLNAGGTAASGGQGGINAQGGASGATTPCDIDAGSPVAQASGCNEDKQCRPNQYCDVEHCHPNACQCASTGVICDGICVHACTDFSTSCTHVADTFTTQLTGDACTVMVRVNAAGTQITGYRVSCASHAVTTEEAALNQLLVMSSINWSGAKSIADASTGLYAFTTSDTTYEYVAYFNRSSGKLLLIVANPRSASSQGQFRSDLGWGSASELGSSCAPGATVPALVYLGSFQMPNTALQTLMQTDIARALSAKGLEVKPVTVTMIDAAGPEYLFLVSTYCPTC